MNINSASYAAAAYSASAAYQTNQASFSLSASYLEITGGVNGSYSDDVSVSDQVRDLLDRIKQLDVFSVIYPNNDARQKTKSIAEVQNDFLGDFNNFASAWGQMASLMGLDSSQSFNMGLDGQGGMTVSGSDQAAADKVQNSFGNNSTLVARFAVMAARAALVDANSTVDGFQDAYASDPVAAITENIDALKERLLGFRTVASGGDMRYGFMRDAELSVDYSETTASYAVDETVQTA